MVVVFGIKNRFVWPAGEFSGFPLVQSCANLQREVQLLGDDRSGIARADVRARDDDSRIRNRLNDAGSLARLFASKLSQRQRHRRGSEDTRDVTFAFAMAHEYQSAHIIALPKPC